MEMDMVLIHIEALIFASDKAITLPEITESVNQALGLDKKEHFFEACLHAIKEKYDVPQFPFHLVESGGGYQFLTKKAYHKTVMQLNGDKHIKKLSAAAMETLSIIAYKQPVTKGEIEYIRGVSADYSIQKLLEKELIVIAGRNEDVVGKPLLYTTSKSFMDYLGINSATQLPQIKDITDKEIVMPTNATEAQPVAPAVLILKEHNEFRKAS